MILLKFILPVLAIGAFAFIGIASANNSEAPLEPRNVAAAVLKFLAHVITQGRNA